MTTAQTATLVWYMNEGGVVSEAIHSKTLIADHLDPLPLCWVAEGRQRGATVEEWEVSFDHETLPSYSVIDSPSFVTCADCKEWMHA